MRSFQCLAEEPMVRQLHVWSRSKDIFLLSIELRTAVGSTQLRVIYVLRDISSVKRQEPEADNTFI
jgi:hypothetical protein